MAGRSSQHGRVSGTATVSANDDVRIDCAVAIAGSTNNTRVCLSCIWADGEQVDHHETAKTTAHRCYYLSLSSLEVCLFLPSASLVW